MPPIFIASSFILSPAIGLAAIILLFFLAGFIAVPSILALPDMAMLPAPLPIPSTAPRGDVPLYSRLV